MSAALANAYNVANLRDRARRRLPRGLFDERVSLRPRMLVDVSTRNLRTELFGKPCIPFTLSTASVTSQVMRFMGCPTVAALDHSLLDRSDWKKEQT